MSSCLFVHGPLVPTCAARTLVGKVPSTRVFFLFLAFMACTYSVVQAGPELSAIPRLCLPAVGLTAGVTVLGCFQPGSLCLLGAPGV